MTSNTNISKTVSHSIVNYTVFWNCVTIPFTCIYADCFNRLRFLGKVSTKLPKCTFLGNLRTITQEGNIETRQMTPFFSSIFSNLTVCNIHFWIWKYSKLISFSPPFCPLWSAKYLNFWPKATNSDSSLHFSLESRRPEVTNEIMLFYLYNITKNMNFFSYHPRVH